MHRSSKGFSTPAFVFIIATLFVVGLVGWIVYDNRQQKQAESEADDQLYSQILCDNGTGKGGIQEGLQMGVDLQPTDVTIVSTSATSPVCPYTVDVMQEGDGYSHTISSGNKTLFTNYSWDPASLPGYNQDWTCQCGGPEFVGWTDSRYFVVELRAQSMDGEKMHYYHMNVEPETVEIIQDSFQLTKTE